MLLVCYVLLYVVALCVKMRCVILCIKRLLILIDDCMKKLLIINSLLYSDSQTPSRSIVGPVKTAEQMLHHQEYYRPV